MVCVYVPNSGAELKRLKFRTGQWDESFARYLRVCLRRLSCVFAGSLVPLLWVLPTPPPLSPSPHIISATFNSPLPSSVEVSRPVALTPPSYSAASAARNSFVSR